MAEKTWPWEKSELNHDTFAQFEAVKIANGVETGLEVLSDGTLRLGAFAVNGHHWVEESDVTSAFDFSPLLNQSAQSVNTLYAQYTYTATIPHATAVYSFAASLPSNAISLGVITVPAFSTSITGSMIDISDSARTLSNRYIVDNAIIGSDPRIPTQDEKDALAGIAFPPSAANKFATNSDLTALGSGTDNLGNHIATQDINFSNFKGINCAPPVNPTDIATRQFVIDNIVVGSTTGAVAQLRKQVAENALLIDSIRNSPYPDNFGQPFYRTTFDFLFNYTNDINSETFSSDHDLKATTANIVTIDKAERSRSDLRLELPDQKYYGETAKTVVIPDVSDRPHSITYVSELGKVFMVTYGTKPNDTALHCIDPITMEVESTWFFDETTFSRWNGIASGITYGAGQLFLVERNAVTTGSVCIRFSVAALPPDGQKITKLNVLAIESAASVDVAATDSFVDIAFDSGANVLWAIEHSGVSNHRLTRLKTDYTENGILRAGGADIVTSGIDTEINGIDFDGNFLWFTGNTWTGKAGTDAVISSKFAQHGRTGICRVTDSMFPAISGNIFCTDQNRNDMKMISIENAYAYAIRPDYIPTNRTVKVNTVNDTSKTVSLFHVDGNPTAFKVNEFAGLNLRWGDKVWKISSSTATEVVLDTTETIASIAGVIEIGSIVQNNVSNVTVMGKKVGSFEGGKDIVTTTEVGLVLNKNTVVNAIGIQLGTVTTPGTLEIRVETDNAGAASGTLADPASTVTIPGANIASNKFNETAFASTFTLSANTLYHIKYIKAFTGDVIGSAVAQLKGIGVGAFNYKMYNSATLPASNVSSALAYENRISVGLRTSLGVTVHAPDEVGMSDTFISENSPADNNEVDEFLRLGAGDIDKWNVDTDGPIAVSGHTMTFVAGINKAYLFGGISTTGLSSKIYEYTRGTNTWVEKTPATSPTARENHVAVAYNNKLYIQGGHDGTKALGDFWVYDPAASAEGAWTQLSNSVTRQSHAAVVVGDNLYIHGGFDTAGNDDLYMYSFTGNTWSQLTNGATTRWNHSMVGNATDLFVFGGYDESGRNDVWRYNIASGLWNRRASGSTARWGHTATLVGDIMYVVGGANTEVLNDIWAYHIVNDMWERKKDNTEAMGRHSAVGYATEIFVYGGWAVQQQAKAYSYALPTATSVSRALLKFDLTSLPTVATSVKLGLYVSRANNRVKVVDLHQLNQSFSESQVSWNESSTSTPWSTVGGDFVSVVTNSINVKDSVGYVEFDITALYNSWKSGAMPNNGVVIKLNNETVIGDVIDIFSSGSEMINRRPRLAINTLVSNNNASVISANEISTTLDYSSVGVRDIKTGGEFVFRAIDNGVDVVDKVDDAVIYSLRNNTTPSISSSVVTGMSYAELPVGSTNSRINKFLAVACDNGVTIVNLDTGTSYKILNYEFASDSTYVKDVVISDRGYLYITYRLAPGIEQVAMYGNIGKINSDHNLVTWFDQTGAFEIFGGFSTGGILASDLIGGIDVVSKSADLYGHDTDLLYVANGKHIVEVDVSLNRSNILGVANQDMVYRQVMYHRNTVITLLTNSDTVSGPDIKSQINVYDVFTGKLFKFVSNTQNSNSHYFLQSPSYSRFSVADDKLILVNNSGLEIIALPRTDTSVFGPSEWHTEKLVDTNGIARLTTMSKDIELPRERVELSSAFTAGSNSISVTFGSLGPVVSPGDTLNIYSTEALDAGHGERIVVSAAYDGVATLIPLASTSLAENIDETSFVVKLADANIVKSLPTRGVVRINSEEIEYEGKSGQNIIVSTRGSNGTTAASHAMGDTVETVLSNDYKVGDAVTFQIADTKTDAVLDVRVHESADNVTFGVSDQVPLDLANISSGYFSEITLSDFPYGKLVYNLKSSQYGGTIKIGKTSTFWENF